MNRRYAHFNRYPDYSGQFTAYARFPHARYIRPNGSPGTITIDAYIKNPPTTPLFCPNCEANLVFREGGDMVAGHLKTTRPHFATKSGSEHSSTCRFRPEQNGHDGAHDVDKERGLRLNFNLNITPSLPEVGEVIAIHRGRRGQHCFPNDIAQREARSIKTAADIAGILKNIPSDRRQSSVIIHAFMETAWPQFFIDMRHGQERVPDSRTAYDLADTMLTTHMTHPAALLFRIDEEQMTAARALQLGYETYVQGVLPGLHHGDISDATVTPRLIVQSAFAKAAVTKPGAYLAIGFPEIKHGTDDAHFYMDMRVEDARHICAINPSKIKLTQG